MLSQELVIEPVITLEQLYPKSLDEFLQTFQDIIDLDIEAGISLDFLIDSRSSSSKIAPRLVLASPEHAALIVSFFEETYDHSYPYKEFLDVEKVESMITSMEYNFILFFVDDEIVGTYKFCLDFEHRRGCIGGLMVKPEYRGKLDVTKVTIGALYWAASIHREVIDIWYCENRTAHAASQHFTRVCGMNALAIFPNKDVFFNEVESDVLCASFSEHALEIMRKCKRPQLIRNATESYFHTDEIYNLGGFELIKPYIFLDYTKIEEFQTKFRMDVIKDKYGYEYYQSFIKDTKSYFMFLHTTTVQNFEKVKYHIESLEELYVYLTELKRCMVNNNIRYVEVFVSAYQPEQQQLFYNFGFRARGYTPAWSYNKISDEFEDQIVFNYYIGQVKTMELLPQGWNLVNSINLKVE